MDEDTTQPETNQHDQVNVEKQGERYKATVTRYFDSQEEGADWGDSVLSDDSDKQKASTKDTANQE